MDLQDKHLTAFRKFAETVGELVTFDSAKPLTFPSRKYLYFVLNGQVDIFHTTLKNDQPQSSLYPVISVSSHEIFSSFFDTTEENGTFIAYGMVNTEVAILHYDQVHHIFSDDTILEGFIMLMHHWASKLMNSLISSAPPNVLLLTQEQEGVSIQAQQSFKGFEIPFWARLKKGRCTLGGEKKAELTEGSLFPLHNIVWYFAISDF